ncbi:ABC transporter substrate-binding protein [Methanolapillus millepedarum]|uniref:Aliphatic sulfonates-binding protein n=1 Tax=Methanolapillus millepedarum TaxID=3028296 RepID=A0AA96V473_9EURY|nr:Putative aliphatic sulfonates-binding protein [Methanosarcinaceae archaeon Ac7]
MKKVLSVLLIALLAATVALSGCVGNDSGKSTNVTIGYQPSTHQMAYTSAESLGWWTSNLTELNVTAVGNKSFPSGPSEAVALSSNAIQVAYIGAAPVIPAVAQNNADLKIVAAVQINGSSLVVPVNATYNGPQDLVGKKIATFPPGSIQDTLLKAWLLENGVNLSQVEIKGMDGGEAQTALASGSVDAVFLPHPTPSVIEQNGIGKIVYNSGQMEANHACCVIAVSQKFIDEHPDIVKEIVRVHIDATEYTNQNPEQAAEYYAKMTGVSKDVVLASINEWDGQWVSDPHMIEDYVVSYSQSQYEQGLIPRSLTAEDLFDTSFYDEIMAERNA